MMKKTFSQKVGIVSGAGVILMTSLSFLAMNLVAWRICFFPFLVFNLFLFIGYLKHFVEIFPSSKIQVLWIATIIYNQILLLPSIYLFCISSGSGNIIKFDDLITLKLIWLAQTAWWLTSTALAIAAMIDENQKYR